MDNRLKENMRSGQPALGTFIEIGNMNGLEALTGTGLDYVVIDAEHGQVDSETITDLIRAAELSGLVPLVRIGEVSRALIQRVLDAGAGGLIVPGLRSVAEVREVVRCAKFPPLGQRGYCPNRSVRWGAAAKDQSLADYMEDCNESILVLPQCETVELLEAIEDAAVLPGVDGIFIGPFDLSIALGLPGQFDDPRFTDAVARVRQTVQKSGKFLFYFSTDPRQAGPLSRSGFQGITLSLDTLVLHTAYKNLISTAQAALAEPSCPTADQARTGD